MHGLVESVVNELAKTGQIVGVRMSIVDDNADEEPWRQLPSKKRKDRPIQGPFPSEVEMIRGNLIYIPKAGLPEPMLDRLIRIAAFQNPEFYKAQAMRLSTWGKPRVISCAEEFPQYIGLPRGCFDEARDLLKAHRIRVATREQRVSGRTIDVIFHGNLRHEQEDAITEITQHEGGILCAPTAFGKTVVASKLIAKRGVNTLILVGCP